MANGSKQHFMIVDRMHSIFVAMHTDVNSREDRLPPPVAQPNTYDLNIVLKHTLYDSTISPYSSAARIAMHAKSHREWESTDG